MNDTNRRADDTWRSRMEDRLDTVIGELREHVGGCSQLQKSGKEWRDKTDAKFDAMDGKLDKLLASKDQAKGAWWALTKVGAAIVALAGGVAWLFDHLRPAIVIAFVLTGATGV